MKIVTKTAMTAAIAAAMSVAPAQAQTWTDASGTPLLLGTMITATGSIEVSVLGWMGRRTCNVSFTGYVSGSDEITLTNQSDGFTSNCTIDFEGELELPVILNAQYYGSGFRAVAYNVSYQTPVSTCLFLTVPFNWNNFTSAATLATNLVSGICSIHGFSNLQLTGATVGSIKIN